MTSHRPASNCSLLLLCCTVTLFVHVAQGGVPLFIRHGFQEEFETKPTESNEGATESISVTEATDASESTTFETPVTEGTPEKNFSVAGFKSKLTRKDIRALHAARMLEIMDLEADPCEDFYQYACGNWEDHNPLPPDAVGLDTFEKLRENLNLILRDLLQEELLETQENSAIAKAKRLYKSCMDIEKIEERKEEPLLQTLEELGGWPLLESNESRANYSHWADVMARLRLLNNDILVSMWIGPDGKSSEDYVIQLDQGDLGLPSRAYYVVNENQTSVFLAYAKFIQATALALGGTEAIVSKDVGDMLEFEIQLAIILIPAEDRRNLSAMYRKMTIADLDGITKSIPWERYMKGVLGENISLDEPVVVYAFDYLIELGDLLNRTSDRTILNYLMWRFVRHRLNNLDQRLQDLKQDLYALLYGKRQQAERWKYCVSYVNGIMGMAVGSLFVRHYFHEESMNDTTHLIYEIQGVFKEMLQEADWLDYETKQSAIDKLQDINLKIGHPNYVLNDTAMDALYEDVIIEDDKYFENVLRMLQYITREEIKRLHRKVNREMWTITPAIVNAFYSRTRNQIMLPAGILQPPFYHTHFPKAINYGGIGVVIGHEITHGFDDQGRQYDRRGNLRSWWPMDTAERFEEKAQCIIEQYGNYTTRIEELEIPINGVNTQGENIADNGGIRQAFKAYERWLNSTPGALENEYLPGLNLTARQLFFLGFGQVWCGSIRPEAAFSKLKTSLHSPGRIRVIGSLSNFEDFARAFQCPEESKMNPANRCVVW